MSTANFYTKNARAIYALRTVEYYNPETEDWTDEYEDGCEIHDRDDLDELVQYHGEDMGWTPTDEREPGCWQDAGGIILKKTFSVETAAGEAYRLTAQIIRRYGYYNGACLDWDICGDSYDGRLSDWDSAEDFAAALADGELSYLGYHKGWGAGLQAMNKKHIMARFNKALETIAEDCEALCAGSCEEKLICVGRFSNGEAVYQKVA